MQKTTYFKTKIFFMMITLIFFDGCVSSSSYYVLSPSSQPAVTYVSKSRIIGVEKVTVPAYLYKREIAIAKTSNQISFLSDGVWGEDLDEGLTQRIISFLQKKFHQPSVYAYPWGLDREATVKVNVDITKFIAQGDKVYLDANWEVVHIASNKRKNGLFSTTVPTKSDASSIVSAMDRAFGELEEVLAKGVKLF